MPPQSQTYPHQTQQPHEQSFHFPASPHLPAHPQPIAPESEFSTEPSIRNTAGWSGAGGVGGLVSYHGHGSQIPHHASELDAHYWKNMFLELGFGENGEGHTIGNGNDNRSIQQYLDPPHHAHSVQHLGSVSCQQIPNYAH